MEHAETTTEILALLPTLSLPELERLASAIRAELEGRAEAPIIRRITLRKKDLNARGNGTQQTRRVRLPGGTTGWASDLAQDVTGSWSSGSYLAADRKCCEEGYVPVGTVVLAFASTMRGGAKSGRADLSAGVVVSVERGREIRAAADGRSDSIEWGLSTRRRGEEVEVQLPGGEWVAV